jgi:hypothetical protein
MATNYDVIKFKDELLKFSKLLKIVKIIFLYIVIFSCFAIDEKCSFYQKNSSSLLLKADFEFIVTIII